MDRIHEFVHCIQQLFVESSKMTMIPAKLAFKLKLPVWRRFERAAERALSLGNHSFNHYIRWPNCCQLLSTHFFLSSFSFFLSIFLFLLFSLARGYVEENVHRLMVPEKEDSRQVAGVLQQLTIQENIDREEVVNIITDLFLAAADTVRVSSSLFLSHSLSLSLSLRNSSSLFEYLSIFS